MKLETENKKTLSPAELANYGSGLDGDGLFFSHVTKMAGLTGKEIGFYLRVSHTMVDMYKTGDRRDPFTAAREAIAMLRKKDALWLIAPTLAYVAGGISFDGTILTAEQTAALAIIAQAVVK